MRCLSHFLCVLKYSSNFNLTGNLNDFYGALISASQVEEGEKREESITYYLAGAKEGRLVYDYFLTQCLSVSR